MNELDKTYELEQFSKRLNMALTLRNHHNKILYDLKLLFGISTSMICNLRGGKKLPSIVTAKKIADKLKISFEWLLTGTGSIEGFQMNNADEIALIYRYRDLTQKGRKELIKASFNETCSDNELHPINKSNRLEEKQALLRLVVKD